MADAPWTGDAVSLVEAFRAGERSPVEELEATLRAVESSALNAFSFVDGDRALERAAVADVHEPFGGVPLGVKELTPVEGWPHTEASLVFADRVAGHTSTMVRRAVEQGGAVAVGQTTASEFGGLNVSVTKLNGVTGNAWDPTRTAGGSSGGSAAAVAGGLVPIATGGDGGGSIRIPAGFNGLLGLKGTIGRIPRGPYTQVGNFTVVVGCLARSVRDAARWFDVCAGYDSRDPYSLPSPGGWEAGLGTHDLRGLRIAVVPHLATAVVHPAVEAMVRDAGEQLVAAAGLRRVDDVVVDVPGLGFEWAMSGLAGVLSDLGDRWPEDRPLLTEEMAFGVQVAEEHFDLAMAARVLERRTAANEAMAAVFDQVDLVLCATNPDVAYPAGVTLNTRVGEQRVGPENNGALTIPANITGCPAVSIPIGVIDGLPVGMQLIARHHADDLLLDLAGVVERERPWPLVAPGAPV
ncbi:MAG: amidase [Acidimicrobiales bacterium]|jgi:aspartyl-tRNA(Asn)/glutamyl-tRNA(Gln) amidotransferase subunit A|nr:amidase [Acidimicrobiales bacterium]